MCDYSLEAYRSRPARKGEQYITRRFPSHGVGFISPGDPETAICMSCGMTLRLEGLPDVVRCCHSVGPDETVTFVRIEQGSFHDGIRFANGSEIPLPRLGEGVKGYVVDGLEQVGAERELVHAW